MVTFSPGRSLMQVNDEESLGTLEKGILIGFGVFIVTGLALTILSCLYFSRKMRIEREQNNEYANWTSVDDIPESFKQMEVHSSRRNPLHIAIQVKNLPLVQELVEKKIQSCTYRDRDGSYALHHAAESGSIEMLRYIARHIPDDFRPVGRSPLHVAAEKRDFTALSYLIQKFPELQKNQDWRESYLDTLCVQYIGMNTPVAGIRNDWKMVEFIHVHKSLIPKELFKGVLLPFRDFDREASSIEMTALEDPLLV